jgi:putative redox protein
MADTLTASLRWSGGLRFAAESQSGYSLTIDNPARAGHRGPSPMELLLLGIGGCTGMDVAAILEKMRQPLTGMWITLAAERAASNPKRFTAIEIVYALEGDGLSREKAEHAIELSQSTYCSAVASLRPDCPVTHKLLINGE